MIGGLGLSLRVVPSGSEVKSRDGSCIVVTDNTVAKDGNVLYMTSTVYEALKRWQTNDQTRP